MPTPAAPKDSTARSWTIIILASLAASGWGVAWWRGSVSTDQRMTLETVTNSPADVRALEDRLRALEFENLSLKNQAADKETPAPAPEANDAGGGRGGRDFGGPGFGGGMGGRDFGRNFAERMKTDPAFAQMVQSEATRRVEEKYASLIKQMRLNPEQAKQLVGLLASRELAQNTAWANARENGINPRDGAAMAAFTKSLLNPINDAIKGVLGDQGYTQMTQWESNAPYREQVQRLENRLAVSGQELQPYQRDAMVQVLANAQTQAQVQRPGRNADPAQWQQYFDARQAAAANTVVRAQSVLSTQQAQDFADLLNTQVNNEKVRYQAMQAEIAARQARQAAEQQQQQQGGATTTNGPGRN